MPTTPKVGERYIPDLRGKAHDDVATQIHRAWLSLYDLNDKTIDLLDQTLTANFRVDRQLQKGKPLLVILRQDTVGGWTVQWATNPDGSLKFKGTNLITLVTTLNTYTAVLFWSTGPTEAILITYSTGGSLG